MRLKGEVAIVTGAGRGIGEAVALLFAEEGADVAVPDIDLAAAERTAARIEQMGRRALPLQVDVTDGAAVRRMVAETVARLGRLDILVNNAGVIGPGPSEDLPEEAWDRVVNVDLKGVFLCAQAAGKYMLEHGGGRIVNVASIAAAGGFPMRASYCAAKAGVVALTKVLATEWAERGVRVNAVGPGYVATDLVKSAIAQGVANEAAVRGRTPMRRLAEPVEIARAILFLASAESSYVTGHTLYVDGGWVAHGAW